MSETWKKRIRGLADLPFLAVFSVYLIHLLFQSSTFYLPVPDKFLKKLFLLLCLTLLFRFPVYLEALKAQKKALAAALLLAVNYALVYYFGDHLFLLFSAVLTIGFLGMDHQKVLKLFTIILGCFLILTFSAACCGAIQDFVMMKDGYIRTALGICYPTDMASYVLFLLMYSWAAWKRIPDLIAFALGIVCFFFSRYIAMSITSTICSAVFCAVVLGHFLCIECGFAKRFPVFLQSLVRQLITFAFPLLALLMFVLIFAYSKNIGPALRLNNLLSKRLELPLDAFRQYGLKPFGTPFDQNGNGFTTFASNKYNFVDSTYPLVLLRYGWILFFALCASWTWTTRKAFRNQDTRLACLLAMIAFHSFSEHHFIETNFNVLLVLPFAMFLQFPVPEEQPVREIILRSAKILLALSTAACVFTWILPIFFTWMRTIFQINHWIGGGRNGILVIRALTAIYISVFLAAAGFLYSLSVLISRKTRASKKKAAAGILASAASLAVLFSLVQSGNKYIVRSVPKYTKQLAEDQQTLQLITDAASGKVYVDSVPLIYQQIVPGISNSLFLGDELARFYNTSVIMDIKHDSNCFINCGFLFTPISGQHALYTNDSAVISELKKQGYHLTGYYNIDKTVNLKYLARLNHLPYASENGLTLSGNGQALKCGPFLSLYSGSYTVEYNLRIPESTALNAESFPDHAVVSLRVSAYKGEKILKDHVIKIEDFDQNRTATVKVLFSSGNYSDIEFLAFPENNQAVSISSIHYYRSPQYDVHMLYNKKREKYREEYYTLDGKRCETTAGYSACEYKYNYSGKVTEVKYFDSSDHLTLTTLGYAILKRDLDSKNRTVRESYYDADDKPVLCGQGYASVAFAYDQDDNTILYKYFDTEGAPTQTASLYAELHQVYDDRHHVILESYFDKTGKPFTMPQGYSMLESQYDSSGRPYIQKYLNSDGIPVMTSYHYAEIHREYTPQNWVAKETYFDEAGVPISLPEGHSMLKRSFDSAGNVICQEYCDEKGQRIMTTLRYSCIRRRYNEYKQSIYEGYFGTDDMPLLLPENYSSVTYERDEVGNAVNVKFYGVDGRLTLRSEGYAEIRREFNELRQDVHDIYCDINSIPVITSMGYAEIRREYDSHGWVSRESYFDPYGNPLLLPLGYASSSFERDDWGYPLVLRFYDLDGSPAIRTDGFSIIHKTYDSEKNIISESYYSPDESPALCSSGFHKVDVQWNSLHKPLSFCYYGTDLEPTLISWGFFEERRTYNADGTLNTRSYYNLNGNQLTPP